MHMTGIFVIIRAWLMWVFLTPLSLPDTEDLKCLVFDPVYDAS